MTTSNNKTGPSRVKSVRADGISDTETVEDGNKANEAHSIDPDTSGVSAEAVPVCGSVNDQTASVTDGGFTGGNVLSDLERVRLLDDLNAQHLADDAASLGGDEETFLLRLDTAITFHRLGGKNCPELVRRAKFNGAADNPRVGQSDEHWLAPGFTGVNLNNLKDDHRRRASDRMTALADVMIAAEWKAVALGGILSERVNTESLAGLFTKPRQQAVRKAKQDRAKGLKAASPDALTDSDIEGEEKAVDFSEALAALKGRPDLAKLHLRLDRPEEVFALACYRDEDGDHIAMQINLAPEVLKAALAKPDLKDRDGRLNAISDHVLIAKHLIPNRESDEPELAEDPQGSKLKAVRATLVHDSRMETTIYMVGSPEIMVVSRLNEPSVFGTGYHMVNANSRNAFEGKVAEPSARVGYEWAGVDGVEVRFKRGKKLVPLKLIPAENWGSSPDRDVYAHRLGRWAGIANLYLDKDEVARMEAEYLGHRESRRNLPVEVSLDSTAVSFKLGKAKAISFPAAPGGGVFKPQIVTVPAKELGDVLELAIGRSKDGKLYFDADPAGVLEVSFTDLGARHSVYLAKLTDAGARENGSVFQRYTKADFAPADQQEAA